MVSRVCLDYSQVWAIAVYMGIYGCRVSAVDMSRHFITGRAASSSPFCVSLGRGCRDRLAIISGERKKLEGVLELLPLEADVSDPVDRGQLSLNPGGGGG